MVATVAATAVKIVPANPVLGLDLRLRFRGSRAMVLLTVHLFVLAAVVVVVYQARTGGSLTEAPPVLEPAEIGRSVFQWVLLFMVGLMTFSVPVVTAGSVAGERERRTLIPLQVTMLSPQAIVAGKLGGSLAFVGLLVTASLPMLAVGYAIGGVPLGHLVASVVSALFVGIVLACLTLACSAAARTVQTATAAAFGAVLLLVLGTFLIFIAAGVIDRSTGDDPVEPSSILLLANPAGVVADVAGEGGDDAPASAVAPLDSLGGLVHRSSGPPFWLMAGIGQAGLAAGAVVVAVRQLQTPR